MKRHAAAAERNRRPILEALSGLLPPNARVLEIGSGTGQHAAHFTEERPDWTWQPSDGNTACLESIEAYRRDLHRASFLSPILLDVRADDWPSGPYDAVFGANVVHISPWEVCRALIDGAARVLSSGGLLVLYGPFRFGGEFTAESNAAFDARLRSEDPSWGVRDVDDIAGEAHRRGFSGPEVISMPANNHVLVFRR